MPERGRAMLGEEFLIVKRLMKVLSREAYSAFVPRRRASVINGGVRRIRTMSR